MNILDKRPLSTVLLAVLTSFVFFCRFPTYLKIIFIILNLAFIIISFLPRIYFPPVVRIVFILSIIGGLISDCYFNTYFFAEKRFDDEIKAEGVVTDISYAENYGAFFTFQTNQINDEKFSRYKLTVVMEDVDASSLSVGDHIVFFATLSKIENESDYADGISALATVTSDYEWISHDDTNNQSILYDVRSFLDNKIFNVSDNKYVGGLLNSLLLGNRSELSKQLSLDFKRIGISHILALSGMHLSILSLLLTFLLKSFGFGKKASSIILLFFIPAYVILTGGAPSILRAGIMLFLTTLLYLIGTKSDSLTTLLISVFIILLFQPYAVFSISLWLSALSTFGILTIPQFLEFRPTSKVFCFILSSLIISFSALIFTLPISAFTFGTFSWLAPISTFVVGLLIQGYIYLGLFVLIFGTWIPVCSLLDKLYELIVTVSAKMADIPFCTIDVSFVFTKILIILFAVCAFLFLVLDVEKKTHVFISLALFLCMIAGCGALAEYFTLKDESLYYLPKEKDEYIIGTSESESILFDFSRNRSNTVFDIKNDLSSLHVLQLETLVITQYSSALPSNISLYLSYIPIENIYLPECKSEKELAIYRQIETVTQNYRVSLFVYNEKALGYAFHNLSFHPTYLPEYTKSSGSVFVFSRDANTLYTYFGKGTYDRMKKETATDLTANSVGVIFGCHGYSSSHNDIINLHNNNLEIAVFADYNIRIERENDLSNARIPDTTTGSIIPLYVE